MDELNDERATPLDHQQRLVTETEDNPVVRDRALEAKLAPIREEQAKQRLVSKIGFAVVGVLAGVPKLGGPTAQQAVSEAVNALGAFGSVVAAGVVAVLGLLAHIKTS